MMRKRKKEGKVGRWVDRWVGCDKVLLIWGKGKWGERRERGESMIERT